MRVMVMVKATRIPKRASCPSEQLLPRWASSTRSWSRRASCSPARGCTRARKGKRVRFSGEEAPSFDGPFAETKELIAGYWMWQVKSMDEAVEWVEALPEPDAGRGAEIEIRPVFEAEDFGEEFTPELREQESGCATS